MVLQKNQNISEINHIMYLTEEEEKKYVKLFGEGDMNAREKLIVGNLGLVDCVVKQEFRDAVIERTELVSDGIIGLIIAVDTFKADKNIKMSTYIYRCIKNRLCNYCKYNSRHPNYNAENLEIFDKITCDSSTYEYEKYENMEVIAQIMENILNCLEYKQKVYMLYHLSGIGTSEISERYGVSRSYICRILRQARENLKELKKITKNKRFTVQVQNRLYKISFEVDKPIFYKEVKQIISKSKYIIESNKNVSSKRIEIYVNLEKQEIFGVLAEIIECMEKI